MTYLNAPSTKLLNTNCAACHRPLVDAESVTAGMGPICRRKYGQQLAHLSEEDRARANKMINACARMDATAETVNATIIEFSLIGLTKLAEKIAGGRFALSLTITDEHVDVRSPYSPTFLSARGRGRWVRDEKVTRYLLSHGADAAAALTAAFSERGVIKLTRGDEATFIGFDQALIQLRKLVADAPAEEAVVATVPAAAVVHECGWTQVSGEWGASVPSGKRPLAGQIVRITNRAGKATLAKIKTVGRSKRWGTPCTVETLG